MADDLEAVLRETHFHPRMLPDLLREAFGAGLSNSQETMSSVTPEMLASLNDVGTGTDEIPPAEQSAANPGWGWRRVAAVGAAAAVTLALGALLLARGGGGPSHARVQPPAPAAAPAPVVAPPIAPSVEPTAPAAPPERDVAGGGSHARPRAEADARTNDDGKRHRRSRRHRSSRKEADADRVVRGLSVDPFAEAARGGKP